MVVVPGYVWEGCGFGSLTLLSAVRVQWTYTEDVSLLTDGVWHPINNLLIVTKRVAQISFEELSPMFDPEYHESIVK